MFNKTGRNSYQRERDARNGLSVSQESDDRDTDISRDNMKSMANQEDDLLMNTRSELSSDSDTKQTYKCMSDHYKRKGIDIDEETIEELRQAFDQILSVYEPQSTIIGYTSKRFDPY